MNPNPSSPKRKPTPRAAEPDLDAARRRLRHVREQLAAHAPLEIARSATAPNRWQPSNQQPSSHPDDAQPPSSRVVRATRPSANQAAP
jgi:hypothetical protein